MGTRWGYLLVTGRAAQPDGHRLSHWNVICRCGKRFTVRADALTGMKSPKRSCGECSTKYRLSGIFTRTEIGRQGERDVTRFGK
jgi:hypothetical protein